MYESLDLLFLGALDHLLDIDTLEVDLFGRDLVHDLVSFHNRHLCVLAHGLIEVVLGFSECAVAESVCFCDFDECIVPIDGFFHHVCLAVEFASLFGR